MAVLDKDDPRMFLADEMTRCFLYLRGRNIPVADPDHLTFEIGEPRSMHRASGYCLCTQGSPDLAGAYYTLIIRSTVLSPKVPAHVRRGILMHELIHTAPGCMRHDGIFRQYAEQAEHDGKITYCIREHFSPTFLVQYKEESGCIMVCPPCGCRYRYAASEMRRLYKRGVIDADGDLRPIYSRTCAECKHPLVLEHVFPGWQTK